MNPSHIFFKQLDIDQGNTFTADITKENEIENVAFSADSEYAITGLTINSIFSDCELLKIENVKEQNKVSLEIQDLTKNYKEPDLTLFISNTEIKTVEIPFVKKNESDLSRIKLTYYNSITKKTRTFQSTIISNILKILALTGYKMIQALGTE